MLISLGAINIKWILFILVPLFTYLCMIIEIDLDNSDNLYFIPFLQFLSSCFNFIFWLISYKSLSFVRERKKNESLLIKRTQTDKKLIDEKDSIPRRNSYASELELYERDLLKKKAKLKLKYLGNIFLLILTGFLDFFSFSINFIINKFKIIKNVSGGLTILSSCTRLFFIGFFYRFSLNGKKLEKHQYFSAIIILIVVIIVSILSFLVEEKNNNKNYFYKLVLMIFPEILYSCKYIVGILYLMRSQGNIYKLIFICGIIGVFLSILFQIILLSVNCRSFRKYFIQDFHLCNKKKLKTILNNFESFDNFGSILTFLLIIFYFVKNICIWLLIYNFSINHFAAIHTIPSFFSFINSKNDFEGKIHYILGCIIIILMTLIYNQIIILNFYGFNKDTRNEIIKRAVDETKIGPIYDVNEEEDELDD